MDEVELGDSSYAKSVILGGMDGVMITVGILCASMGGGLATEVLLVVGFSMIIAQALNIGIGEYLSSKAHRQFVLAEKRRAMWEFKHNPLAKREIMSELFESKGMSRGDAELVTRKMSAYERFFVDLMVTEELRLVLPGK
jgi:DNA damage-binding protein 1